MSNETMNKTTPAPLAGAPCWIEIMGSEPMKLKEFYAALFPAWKFRQQDIESKAEIVHIEFEKPSGLTGGILKRPGGVSTSSEQPMCFGSTVYYYVPSIEEIGEKIIELGGMKVLEKKAESDHGWYANFKDPEGNRFGVYEVNWDKQ